jgi:S1-C subfamily serine protease
LAPASHAKPEPEAVAAAPPGLNRTPSSAPSGPASPAVLYALLGVSGLAVVLLGLIVVLLLSRGDDREANGAGRPQADIAAAPARRGSGNQEDGTRSVPATGAEEPAPLAIANVIVPTVPKESSNESTGAAATVAARAVAAPSPVASIPAPSIAPDPQEIIRRLKDAAVYIKTKVGPRTISSGSGFVIERLGVDGVLVATNRHVAVLDLAELPPGIVAPGIHPTLEAVFRSGLGPQTEQALPAQIIAADLSDERNTDLAFLMVKGLKNPPAPIDPMIRIEPMEGMTYLGAGFPLGGMLSKVTESKGNPSVTITGGRVARLARDTYGQLALLQVDGSLQPGNSGGPIIDEKSGKLLGVAVAKVGAVDTIGFVVLAEEVRRALAGRFGSFDLTLEYSAQAGTANLLVKALLVDPKLQVSGVVVHAAPASAVGTLNPNSDGTWAPMPNTQAIELRRDARSPVAVGHVQIAVAGSGASARKLMIQAAHRDLRGRLVYSKPQEVLLPDQPGPIRPAGDLARFVKSFRAKSMALLGSLVDPSKDCRLDKDERSYKIRIDVPGKLHSLSPELTSRVRGQPLHNAPMTLTEVEGDFAAVVEVTGEINPGATPPKDRATRGLGFTVQSAGLILYQDKNNFLRLERAGSIFSDTLRPVHRLIIEAVKDGKQAMTPIYVDVPEGDTLLIMERRKGRVRCMYSPSGGHQIVAFRQFALNLPPKVKVGLSASNVSAAPFSATFENFTLLSDVTKLEQAFGE